MSKNDEEKSKSGFIFENKDVYVTKQNKVILIRKFKELCRQCRIRDWRKELKKL